MILIKPLLCVIAPKILPIKGVESLRIGTLEKEQSVTLQRKSQFWYHIENFWNNLLQNRLVDYEISSRKFVKIY